jgi:hypothetical protein
MDWNTINVDQVITWSKLKVFANLIASFLSFLSKPWVGKCPHDLAFYGGFPSMLSTGFYITHFSFIQMVGGLTTHLIYNKFLSSHQSIVLRIDLPIQ